MSPIPAPAPAPQPPTAPRAADQRHDVRVLRRPRREAPQPPRRRRGDASTTRPSARRVELAPQTATTAQDVVEAVKQAGYEAILPTSGADDDTAHALPDPVDALRRRLIFAAIATVPLLALGMIPALQFDNWQWISLQLATPVLVLGRLPLPPRRLDEPAPRHGDDGHAHLGRHDRRLELVGDLAAVPRPGRSRHAPRPVVPARARRRDGRDLLRGGRRRRDVPARRALVRGARQAQRRRGAAGAAGSSAPRRSRSSTPTASSCASRSAS